jgi:hypothetical protein
VLRLANLVLMTQRRDIPAEPFVVDRRTALRWAGSAGLAGLLTTSLPGLAAASPAQGPTAAATFSPLRPPATPPATPLVVRSMYLSTWQGADNLAGTWPTFWNGGIAAMAGIVRVDGTAFLFAGAPAVNGTQLPVATQTALVVTATTSHYTFQVAGIQLDVTFFSPVDPDDLRRQSVPFGYVTMQATSIDGAAHHTSVYFDISGEWAHGDNAQLISWAQAQVGNQVALSHAPTNPGVLQENRDHASWGTMVIAADAAPGLTWQIGEDTVVRANGANGSLPGTVDANQPRAISNAWPVFGFNLDLGSVTTASAPFVICVGHARTPAVSFLGTQLDPWWRTYFTGWQDMLTWFRADLPSATAVAAQLESRLALDVQAALGTGATADQYHALVSLSLRQTFGGTELVNRGGVPWAFLKEISSDGNVSTVDVIYPASPAYLYLSPDYLRMLLAPLLFLAESGGWNQAFAEHDIGAGYPVADGHLSGQEDMPVEESANMLIMTAALLGRLPAADATAFATTHYATLRKWAEYLVANALDPGNQNQTDDFTGFIAHSVNLALKGIIGIGAMGLIATAAGNTADATHYTSTAQTYITQWHTMGQDSSGQHLKLAYDQDGTWSLKYNGYPDKLLGTNLVPDSVAAQESAWYSSQAGQFGVVLDPRNPFTKVDWELWTAAWLNNHPAAATLITGAYGFANTTAQRVPLTDLYTVSTAAQTQPENFRNRPVLGGLFALLTLRNTPNGLVGHWPLDGTGTDCAGNLNTVTASGGASFAAGHVGGGITLDGTSGALSTAHQVLRTDRAFSVTAWVNLANTNGFATAVSQDGGTVSGFFLQYSAQDGRWAFARTAADSTTSATTRALSTAAPATATWTHLAGVYDAAAGQLRLYVNGTAAGTAAYTSAWHAPGALRIGQGRWNAAATDFFPGSIDDVRAYDRALTAAEVASAAHLGDGLVARFALDETAGTASADVVGGHTAVSTGTVTRGVGYAGGGVVLDGATGSLATAAPLVRTDQSFSVSAWAKLTSTATFATVLSQDGGQASGFYLQYSAQDDRWAFAQVATDVANAPATRALSAHAPQAGAWTHVVGVFDATAGQLRIYVNGALAGTAAHTGAWHATGGTQIGRGRWNGAATDFFPGSIDDVRVYSRALSDDDVRTLI